MKALLKNRIFIAILGMVILLVIVFGIKTVIKTDMAHQTFENYYAFRGCVKLIDRTDTVGHCTLPDGQTITLVKFNNKWYLDGDLPMCWHTICI